MGTSNPVVIDLGCGVRKRAGAIGVDIAHIPTVDVLADVTRPLPFRTSSIDQVYASHLVEHVADLLAFMGEVWRVTRPGGIVQLRFPHGTNIFNTWRDPTHRRGIFLDTFDYFDPNTFDGKAFGYYHPAKFEMVKQRIYFNMNADSVPTSRARRVMGRIFDGLANRSERAQYICERTWGNWLGMEEAQIWLRAIK